MEMLIQKKFENNFKFKYFFNKKFDMSLLFLNKQISINNITKKFV